MRSEDKEIAEPIEWRNQQFAEFDSAESSESSETSHRHVENGSLADEAVDPMIGYLLDGRYELLQAIGSGGMSIVYQARLNTVGKMVAIKTLNIQVKTKDNVKERFHREIALLLKLEHPHIVSVQDCLYGPNYQPYLVMDLLRGVTLEQELARIGTVPFDRVKKIMIQTCAAVKYAHQHSVVHRDLKPGNIMLLENEIDFVKVLDFGLAVIGENNHKITQSGEFWGSPPYASPEQVKGEETDHRSDIYSLGCVMYELLSGKDPFHGAGLYELLSKHVNEQPAPLSVTNPQVVVPAQLERIVFRCLAKDPKDRFQTVTDLQAALESMNSGPIVEPSANISRLRDEQSEFANALPAGAGKHSSIIPMIAVMVVLLLIVLGSVFFNQRPVIQKTVRPAVGRSAEPTPVILPAPTGLHSSPSAVSTVRTDSQNLPPPAQETAIHHAQHSKVHNKHAGIANGAMPEAKPAAAPKSDPFAKLKDHISPGARAETKE